MAASPIAKRTSAYDAEKEAIDDIPRGEGQPDSNAAELILNDDAHSPENQAGLSHINSTSISLQRTQTTEDYGKRPDCFSSTLQECLFVLTSTMAVAQSSIIIGLSSVVTSHIANDLHMTQAEVTWISAASSLGAGCFLLFFGKVADMFGRRWLLIISMAAYSVFTLIAGFATGPYYMDVLMGIIGLCSAASVPPAIGILGMAYKRPSSRKNKAFACFSAGNPLGFVAGMLISGISYQISNWRTSFWVAAVIYAFFTVAAYFTVPKDETTHHPFSLETLKKFDYLGTLLAVAGIALFTSALSIAGNAPQGWKTAYVIALLILGFILIIGFVIWQGIFQYPLMPLYIWRDKNFTLLVIILSLGFMGFSANLFWVSLYFQEVKHIEPLGVAVRMLPTAIVGILVNIVAGFIMHLVSNKLLMTIGALSFCACFAIFSAMPEDGLYWAFIFPALCLSVIGADFQFTIVNMYVMSSLPQKDQSIAGAILQTASRIVTSVGLGITTAAFTSLSTSGSAVSSEFRPYRGTWWASLASAGLSLVFVPFLTIERQGNKKKR